MQKNYLIQKHLVKAGRSKTYLFLVLSAFLSVALKAQNTYTFTAAGVTGRIGPTQTQLNSAYASTNLNGLVTSTNGIQSFTLNGGPYRITAIGGQGGGNGTYTGGLGASMRGDFTISGPAVVNIIVGQQGETLSSAYNCGGGGGSYVWLSGQSTPLIVAGGGGGAGGGNNGVDAAITTSGTAGTYGNGTPGTGGNGANPGGGGWLSAGQDFSSGVVCTAKCSGNATGVTTGGASPTTAIVYNGCAGTSDTGDGGFGGGSGGNGYCTTSFGAGGGGGYSGGVGQAGANGITAGGGGGGSYNGGANQTNSASVGSGSGKVIIQELCSITLTASGSNSLNPSICAGQSITLTTNAISNYAWSTGNTTNASIVVSPSVTTVYTLSATSPSNCTAFRSITVTVNSGLPSLTVTTLPATHTVCLGQTATLTAGGALSYTWNSGNTTTVINGQSFTPTATAVYTVTGANGCGTSSAVTTVSMTPLQVSAAAAPTLVCSGSTVMLQASSSVSGYTWAPLGLAGNPVVVGPSVTTVYTVTASDGTCIGTTTVAVATKANPTLNIVPSATMVCQGAQVTMTASGAQSYTWSTGSNSISIVDTPTTPTSYVVSGTNSLNCTASANQIVLTTSSPTLVIAASNSVVCAGSPVTFTASGANTYTWVNGPSTAINTTTVQNTTTYSVVGTGSNCSSTGTVSVNAVNASVAVSAATTTICDGGTTTITASGANTYTWTGLTPGASAIVSPTATTVYTITATTNSMGIHCQGTNSISITVNNNPTVSIVASKTLVCKSDASVTLTGTGAVTYTWSVGTATTNPIKVHPIVTTVYSVTGMDANGCMNTRTVQVTVNPCTGIAELTANGRSISVYPNPNNGNFEITGGSAIELKLVNDLGQEVRRIQLNGDNNYKASVSDVASGVYFLVGENSTEKVMQKLIITK